MREDIDLIGLKSEVERVEHLLVINLIVMRGDYVALFIRPVEKIGVDGFEFIKGQVGDLSDTLTELSELIKDAKFFDVFFRVETMLIFSALRNNCVISFFPGTDRGRSDTRELRSDLYIEILHPEFFITIWSGKEEFPVT